MNDKMDSLHRNVNRLYASLVYYVQNGNLEFLDDDQWLVRSTAYRVSMLRFLKKVKELKEVLNSPFYESSLEKAMKRIELWDKNGEKIYQYRRKKKKDFEP